MNSGTLLLIAGVAIVGVILMTHQSAPSGGPYVPYAPGGGESSMNQGANAVASVLNQAGQFFGSSGFQGMF